MEEYIVKQHVFQRNRKFKQMLEDKRDDPDYADSEVMPFCEHSWKVGVVKNFIGLFIPYDLCSGIDVALI